MTIFPFQIDSLNKDINPANIANSSNRNTYMLV